MGTAAAPLEELNVDRERCLPVRKEADRKRSFVGEKKVAAGTTPGT
jgi:hypothetical protein